MIQQERLNKIVEYLQEKQRATLADIAQLNGVSIDTARRDFEQLEAQGKLKRVRGGAIYCQQKENGRSVLENRYQENRAAKREISRLLKPFIVEGQSVFLNSGTTNIEVAKFLAKNYTRLTVITNNIYVLDILAEAQEFTTIVPGGIVDTDEGSIGGDQCERDILQYNIDTAILALEAVSIEKGITAYHPDRVSTIQAIMKASRRNIFVADHTKFGRVACMNVCPVDAIDLLISDSGLSDKLREAYESRGITVVTSDRENNFPLEEP
ncbi:transcriptional regulator, DeoR family [Oscillibacter sp. PC13]|uniref:DeoR/GlpR family DNA-binding transcription regulator n=1 Tax=Oscillibacter sp. PC13 TaxID=1855299 RepID=UPI0008EF432C|nr:DeoR/GlpR family DNA-binding transcription regulator [Oscillibacter sp. PC13]SFP87851.1 transcriptional regulator, DeoR family [Oscillibacter sp. PC13]